MENSVLNEAKSIQRFFLFAMSQIVLEFQVGNNLHS